MLLEDEASMASSTSVLTSALTSDATMSSTSYSTMSSTSYSTVSSTSTLTSSPTSNSTMSSTSTLTSALSSDSTVSSSHPSHSPLSHRENFAGFYIMLNHIIISHDDVPLHMRNSCIINERNETLAVHWIYIMHRRIHSAILQNKIEEAIPSWMHHSPDIRDTQGWTIAMHWVQKYGTVTPSWMHHNPTYQNNNGKTIAMLYIMHSKEPPNWMHHDTNIFDKDGNSILDYWIACTNLPIPSWINPNNYINGNNEDISIAYLIRRNSPPPLNYHINHKLKTSYHQTYEDLFDKLFNDIFNVIPLSSKHRRTCYSLYRYLFRLRIK